MARADRIVKPDQETPLLPLPLPACGATPYPGLTPKKKQSLPKTQSPPTLASTGRHSPGQAALSEAQLPVQSAAAKADPKAGLYPGQIPGTGGI